MTDARLALEHLQALWQRERAASRERHAETRARLSPAEREARGLLLTDLTIDEVEPTAGGRLYLWLARRSGRPIIRERLKLSSGDPVLLYVRALDDGDGVTRGVIARFRRHQLGVVIECEVPDALEAGGFRLEQDAPEVTFDRGAAALRELLAAPAGSPRGRLREVIYGAAPVEVPGRRAGAEPTPFDAALDAAQWAAVVHALAAEPIALVHGPPGTGKTRTLVEIVRQAVAAGERVLVTAASNVAVDNLAERLAAAAVPLVRLGHPARVLPSVEDLTLDAMLEASDASALARRWVHEARALRRRIAARSARGGLSGRERFELLAEARRLEGDARHHLRRTQEAIVHRHPVVCATAAGATGAWLARLGFDRVVLDEATQAPDPLALIALGHAPRAVLAGDPCQLPPTVLDGQAERGGLGITVFERVADRLGEAAVRMLVVQHRMHATLMRFPSESMYGGRLRAAPSVAAHRLDELPGVAADPLRPGPLVFVDAAGKGWAEARAEDDPSTSNPAQADRVAAEVRRLLGRGLAPEDCAVITPYEAQVRGLRDRLAGLVGEGLEIGTVDGFQGREKEAVVVDLVRSNEQGRLGFLTDVRRMNVAITRARRLLLVVGDSATLGGHDYYAAFLAAAEEAGGWVSAWADDAPPFAGG